MSCECITQVNLQLRDEGHTLATLTSRRQHGAQTQSRALLRTFDASTLSPTTHPPIHPS